MKSDRFIAELEIENLPYSIVYPSTKKNYARLEYDIAKPDILKLVVKGIPISHYSKELIKDIFGFLTEVLTKLRDTQLEYQAAIIDQMVKEYGIGHMRTINNAILNKDVGTLVKYGKFLKFSSKNPVCKYISEKFPEVEMGNGIQVLPYNTNE